MATSATPTVNKKKFKCVEENENKSLKDKKTGMIRSSMKLSRLQKKRLIIRNLSFKVNEEQLKKIFAEFGEILEVKIPLKSDGKKKGFAFVEFTDTKSMIKAMKKLNFQKIHGRPIAIDFAVNKDTYLSNLSRSNSISKDNHLKKEIKSEIETENSDIESNNLKEEIKSEVDSEDYDKESLECESILEETYDNVKSESGDNEDAKKKAFLKEFDVDDAEMEENSESEASAESSEDDEESFHSEKHINNNDSSSTRSKSKKQKQSEDISEGKTVFIRNISFRNTEEDLQEVVDEFGETEYCLFCNDRMTGHFRGTAFVKFKQKESAEKLIEESSNEPGIILDGRKLLCSAAITQEELSRQKGDSEKNKDKRNLRLLKCGLILYSSKESEGVSQTDMAKRAQLEALKKQKLRNVNFFVSDKRLVCHNIPKNINDKDLYKIFKKAAGEAAVIKEARIMKDFKKTDAQGNPVSRGFAFITFTEHEHALKALNELNNNPNIFTANKRPIVEFSVENKVALLSQERRRERIKMLNKKRTEQNNNQKSWATDHHQQSSTDVNIKFKKQKVQKKRKHDVIDNPTNEAKKFKQQRKHNNVSIASDETISPQKKKKQKKNRRKQNQQAQRKSEISALTQMYKEKLLNKIS